MRFDEMNASTAWSVSVTRSAEFFFVERLVFGGEIDEFVDEAEVIFWPA